MADGWITKRHMERGGSIGGRSGKHKGPLRVITKVFRYAEGLFDTCSVELECGHPAQSYSTHPTPGQTRARCRECGKLEPDKYGGVK